MAKFLDIRYLYFLKMFQWIKIRFCVSNQKFVPSFFKVYPNRFYISSFLHTFLRKIPWKLYDPFITFKLQVWRMNYLHISKSFSVCLWNIFENITGMPLRGHLLAARLSYGHTTSRKVSTGLWSPNSAFLTPQNTWKPA